MSDITVWYRWNPSKNKWQFNHISEGYNKEQIAPISVDDKVTKSWKNSKWKAYASQLIDRKVQPHETPDDMSSDADSD